MNLKALITTLVLGSSSMASADSLTFSGSVTVSLGGSSSVPAGGIVRHYEPSAPARPVVIDDCNHDSPASRPYQPVPSRPVVTQPVYQPPVTQPVWNAPWFNITNSTVGATASSYHGWLANSKVLTMSALNRYPNRTPTYSWFDLTEATRIDSGRQFFTIGADNGLFRGLKLQALGNGSSKINQVLVEYADARGTKKSQVFKLDGTLINRNNPTITLDLDGNFRAISRIVVYGATDKGSAYKILAM